MSVHGPHNHRRGWSRQRVEEVLQHGVAKHTHAHGGAVFKVVGEAGVDEALVHAAHAPLVHQHKQHDGVQHAGKQVHAPVVVEVDGGPPLEHHKCKECELGGGPARVVTHKEKAHHRHGRVQRRQRAKHNGRRVEPLGHQVRAGAERRAREPRGVALGVVPRVAVFAVHVDEPRRRVGEHQVGEHAGDVLRAQRKRKELERARRVEHVEPDAGEERHAKVAQHVGEPRHAVAHGGERRGEPVGKVQEEP